MGMAPTEVRVAAGAGGEIVAGATAVMPSADWRPATLLIYVPAPLYLRDGEYLLEDQACNGLRRWTENFERLIVVIPVAPGEPPKSWVPLRAAVGEAMDRIEVVPVPNAFRPDRFLRELSRTVPTLRAAIGKADYLGFALGGLFGDWGAVGAILAHRMGLPFYVWTDRVESEVVRRSMSSGPFKRRLQAFLYHRPMAMLERYLIRRAALGLFHGRETFETYAPFSPQPQLVHDIHLKKADQITAEALAAKQAGVVQGPIRICYVGRADQMKGPLDWIEVLRRLAARGVDYRAVWLGDGADLPAMRDLVEKAGLSGQVDLPGFVTDRGRIMRELRDSHVMMFCHKTPESPRCLIESLAAGTPIVGYDSAYPQDLIAENGGGSLVPLNDIGALAADMERLARDRAALSDLVGRAARDGALFDDETVFHHRAELIRAYLPRARPFGMADQAR